MCSAYHLPGPFCFVHPPEHTDYSSLSVGIPNKKHLYDPLTVAQHLDLWDTVSDICASLQLIEHL